MVADVPVDEEAVIEPATREEELNVGVVECAIGCTDICADLDIVREVTEQSRELVGECRRREGGEVVGDCRRALLRVGGVELPEGHQVEELAVALVLRREERLDTALHLGF